MSDLTATNCGCGGCNGGCGTGVSCQGGFNGCSILIWIIILSCLCGNGGNGILGGGCGDCNDGCGSFGNNSCCWIILLLLFCGNGGGFCF